MWETITVAVVSTSDQRSQLCFSAALHRRLSCETTARDSIQNDVATFATRTYERCLEANYSCSLQDRLFFRVPFFLHDQHRNSVIAVLPNKEFVSHHRYLFCNEDEAHARCQASSNYELDIEYPSIALAGN